MKITLDNPKEIIIVQQETKNVEELNVIKMIDFPNQKRVIAHTLEIGILTLWEGVEYDNIGQWTDVDAQNRIKFLVENL